MPLPRKGTPEYDAWINSPAYEEWRHKMSESHKGQVSPTKGKKHTPEARAKMSVARKGQKLSPEARAKAIENLGKIERNPMSEETKAKISASKKGKKNPTAKGHPQSAETRAKIGESLKEQHASGKRRPPFGGGEGIAEFNRARKQKLGKHHSDETKEKISSAQKGKRLTEEHKKRLSDAKKGKPSVNRGRVYSEERRAKMSAITKAHYASLTPEEQGIFNERRLKAVRYKDTNLEAYVARQLDLMGITYVQQKRVGRYVVDFLLPDEMLIIEVNGCFWHGCLSCGYDSSDDVKRRTHDDKRTAFFENLGYRVAIIWQHDLLPFMKAETSG